MRAGVPTGRACSALLAAPASAGAAVHEAIISARGIETLASRVLAEPPLPSRIETSTDCPGPVTPNANVSRNSGALEKLCASVWSGGTGEPTSVTSANLQRHVQSARAPGT
jgi:hypothetical protein